MLQGNEARNRRGTCVNVTGCQEPGIVGAREAVLGCSYLIGGSYYHQRGVSCDVIAWLVGAVFNFGFALPSFSHHPPPAILNAITILILIHIEDDHSSKMFKMRKGCKQSDPDTK